MQGAVVECHSDTEYADRPLAFTWQGRRLEIAEILGRWRGPNGKSFRIKTLDGQVFDLIYREIPDDWLVFPS
jgi:hypothetical protein